jgi:hypothetical protein
MPTHVGTTVTASCLCGAKKDITDIDTFTPVTVNTGTDIMSAENMDQIAMLYGVTRKYESDDDLKGRIMERIKRPLLENITYSTVGGESGE